MSKRSLKFFAAAFVIAAALGLMPAVLPLSASAFADTAEEPVYRVQTLTSDNVSVTGLFEEGAVLTVETALTAEDAEKELLARDQITSAKQIVGVYKISASGTLPKDAEYTVKITGLKLNPLAKNRVSILYPNGYSSVQKYTYADNTLTFTTDALGEIVLYRSLLALYVIIGTVCGAILLIVAYKRINASRYKSLKNASGQTATPREHDKKYQW